MSNNNKTLKSEILALKKEVKNQAIITRRTIVKTSHKNEEYSLKNKLRRFETKLKEEKQLRKKYPAVNQAYKDYQLTMKLVSSKTN